MAVAVEGDGHLLVPQHLAHDLGVGAGRQLQAGAWAGFRAAGDGPDPVVAIPGALRLILELAILGGAAAALAAANRPTLALVFAALIVVDVASYDRVVRLLTGA